MQLHMQVDVEDSCGTPAPLPSERQPPLLSNSAVMDAANPTTLVEHSAHAN